MGGPNAVELDSRVCYQLTAQFERAGFRLESSGETPGYIFDGNLHAGSQTISIGISLNWRVVWGKVSGANRPLDDSFDRILFACGGKAQNEFYRPAKLLWRCSPELTGSWPRRFQKVGITVLVRDTVAGQSVRYRDGSISLRPGKVQIHTGPAVDPVTLDPCDYFAIDFPDFCIRKRKRRQVIAAILNACDDPGSDPSRGEAPQIG